MAKDLDGDLCFSFEEMKGIRWRIVGSGSAWPEGKTTAYFEWENGVEASFSSYSTDMQSLADKWTDEHEESFGAAIHFRIGWLAMSGLVAIKTEKKGWG